VISISRPFIAVGVPIIVASYWSVDTVSTTDLMIRFHKYRKQGGLSTAEAIRQAQRDMLSGPGPYHHPYYWASFGVFGGYAEF
jgi:CHAT domain-containing protein